jgi:glycerol-3-phosphate dehydrogenase
VMAADAIDAAVTEMAGGTGPVGPSRTEHVPLAGALGFADLWERREELVASSGLSLGAVEHLLRRHGVLTREVLELVAARPELGVPLHPDAEYLVAEVVHAATHEGARHLDDVLVRRTRLALETRDGARSVAVAAAEWIAPVLGWSAADVAAEVAGFAAGSFGVVPGGPGS